MKILQYLGGTAPWGDVIPETMYTKGLGGRETAMINLAEQWAQAGHEVINFVPTSVATGEIGKCRFVPHQGVASYIRNFGTDVCVSWEEPRLFAPELRDNIKLAIIEMQVAHLDTDEGLDENTDYYAVLSRWAGGFLSQVNTLVDPRKLIVFPNGVDTRRYPRWEPAYPSERAEDGSFHFYYSSSPDRGLNHLLNAWPEIRNRYPKATLHVAYGADKWTEENKWTHYMQSESALDIIDGLKQDGIEYHGKIGQSSLAKLQRYCDALLYPCDPMSPTETGCITVVEAGAAGSPAIITDADCLGTEFAESAAIAPLPYDLTRYCDKISEVMNDPNLYVSLQQRGYELARSRRWSVIAKSWLDLFENELADTEVKYAASV